MSENQQAIDISGDGGLLKQILVEGIGEKPKDGYSVTVHYVGTFENGDLFDSSRDRNTPFCFKIGRGHVIKGWDMGVATMNIGEKAILTCRSDYAYGDEGSPPKIPKKATLFFEVELLSVDVEPESIPDRVLLANRQKEKGNNFFKTGDFVQAIQCYDKGIKYFENCWGANDEQKKSMDDCKLLLHLNLAACKMKTGEFRLAILECEKALDIDENNVKAIFRRGQGRTKLCDFESARSDFTWAAKLSPNDTAITNELNKLKTLEAEANKKEKEMFKNMFK